MICELHGTVFKIRKMILKTSQSQRTMEKLIALSTTQKGKTCIKDINMYQYNFDNSTLRYNYWKCSVKSCGALITTIKDTNDMVGENLPHHEHGILRLKRKVQETERDVIKQMAVVQVQ